MNEEAIELLSRGYHNAIHNWWQARFGGDGVDWDKLPETSLNGMESKADIRTWMTQAVVELGQAGFEITRKP